MDDKGKSAAGAYLAAQAARRGWSAARLAIEADLDAQTVRDFMAGERWPWAVKRQAMETAVGIPTGTLELVARGQLPTETTDPIEAAIQGSELLSRANKARLLGAYYDMLDTQQHEAGESG